MSSDSEVGGAHRDGRGHSSQGAGRANKGRDQGRGRATQRERVAVNGTQKASGSMESVHGKLFIISSLCCTPSCASHLID